jgi:hypothetical protein
MVRMPTLPPLARDGGGQNAGSRQPEEQRLAKAKLPKPNIVMKVLQVWNQRFGACIQESVKRAGRKTNVPSVI